MTQNHTVPADSNYARKFGSSRPAATRGTGALLREFSEEELTSLAEFASLRTGEWVWQPRELAPWDLIEDDAEAEAAEQKWWDEVERRNHPADADTDFEYEDPPIVALQWNGQREKRDDELTAAQLKKKQKNSFSLSHAEKYEQRAITGTAAFLAELGEWPFEIELSRYFRLDFVIPDWLRPFIEPGKAAEIDTNCALRLKHEAERAENERRQREIKDLPVAVKGCSYGHLSEAQLDSLLHGWHSYYGDTPGQDEKCVWTVHAGESSWHAGTRTVKKEKRRLWLRNGGTEALTNAELLTKYREEVFRLESLAIANKKPPAWAKACVVTHGAQIKPAKDLLLPAASEGV